MIHAPLPSDPRHSRLAGNSVDPFRWRKLLLPNDMSYMHRYAGQDGALHMPNAQREVRYERQDAAPRFRSCVSPGAHCPAAFLPHNPPHGDSHFAS